MQKQYLTTKMLFTCILDYDENHSEDEDRFYIIGEDKDFRELAVCHCYRGKDDEIIRIISARKATKVEIDYYYGEC